MLKFSLFDGNSEREIDVLSAKSENNRIYFNVNNETFTADYYKISNRELILNHNGRNFRVECLKIQKDQNAISLKINGIKINLQRFTGLQLLLKNMGMSGGASGKVNNVKAPMPGKVLKIMAREGLEVKKGDVLFILEAMKMENAIKSPGDGVVRRILMNEGDAVEKNQALIEF